MRIIILAGAMLAFTAALAQAADAPQVSIAPVAKTNTTLNGQRIAVPPNPNVVVTIATFPPGASLAEHKHPYPHYIYVLEGALTITDTDTGKHYTAKKGDFVVETSNWHFGKNEGSDTVELLAIDQLPDGVDSNRVLKDPKPQ